MVIDCVLQDILDKPEDQWSASLIQELEELEENQNLIQELEEENELL